MHHFMKTMKPFSDVQLVEAYQKEKDPQFFGEIYTRYYQKIYRYCHKLVNDRSEAMDITSDTFVRFSYKIESLRNTDLFAAWLFRIANNLCMDFLRKKKKQPKVGSFEFDQLVYDQSLLESAKTKEHHLSKLEIIINQLDKDTRKLIVDKYFNKKTIEHLERELGLSKSAVKMRLKRAKAKIFSLWENPAYNSGENRIGDYTVGEATSLSAF